MIDNIIIKNVATFDNDGIAITNTKKINFVYGSNGSGKTTISNYLMDSNSLRYHDCSFTWNDGNPIKIQVYNKEFREKNFGKGSIPGVFTLGETTKDKIEKIENCQTNLDLKKVDITKKKATIETQTLERDGQNNILKEYIWNNIFKKNESIFKEAFTGFQKSQKFMEMLLETMQKENLSGLTREEIEEKSKTIFGVPPTNINKFSVFKFDDIIELEANEIWNRKIIGKQDVKIAKLIQKLGITDWVSEGRNYVHDRICPFCQKETITEELEHQIEEFFDQEYENDILVLNKKKIEYVNATKDISAKMHSLLINTENNSMIENEKCNDAIRKISDSFSINIGQIDLKIKEPSKIIELRSTADDLRDLIKIIEKANIKIEKNNEIVKNYVSEKKNTIEEIWKLLVRENKEQLNEKHNKIVGLNKGINALENQKKELEEEKKRLQNELSEITKNMTSVQPSIDEMNRILKSYGYNNFEILPADSKNYYKIQREDGNNAEPTLSEGEVTFITFLYFLQLAKGSIEERDVKHERVLVIDDPISSLDSNILFVISSLIKEICKCIRCNRKASKEYTHIKQLIVLTHNVYFHKEVSFIDGRATDDNSTNFWILRKADNKSSIENYEKNNPIQSSYELLWQELKNASSSSGITIQNIMRRIIENYFKILGKYGDDELILKFKEKEEQEVCRSLLCWINDGSHCMNDDLFIESQDDVKGRYLYVFKRIFEETDQTAHYNMMMGIREKGEINASN